jgi:hypothetical protein
MTKPTMTSVRLDADLAEAMYALQEKHGTPLAEQIRRALRPWLIEQGVLKQGEEQKADRKRAPTRKRP